MRAAAASGKAVVVPEGENDGLTSKADSAQFQSDELEVRHPLIPSLQFIT
jgi:1,4-alpha-glucan branching enzyme